MALFEELAQKMAASKSADYKINTPSTNVPVQGSKAIVNTSVPSMVEHDPFSRGGGFFENAWKLTNTGNEPESQENAKKREKREKARANIAGLADGLSALGNAFAVSKGAQSVRELPSFSDINRQRYEAGRDLRKQNEDKWRQGIFSARMNDIVSEKQRKVAAEKARVDAEEKRYKRSIDERNQQNKEKEFGFKEKEFGLKEKATDTKNTQWEKEFKADQNFKNNQLSIARQKLNAENAPDPLKTERHALSDGTSIQFPKELEDDFYNHAYNKLAEAMKGKEVGGIEEIYTKNFGISSNVTPAAAKKAIVKEYLGNPEYKNVEDDAVIYAANLVNKYKPAPKPQVPGQVTKTETPGTNSSFDDLFGEFEEK